MSIPIFSGGGKYHKIKQSQVTRTTLKEREDAKRNLQLALKQYLDNMRIPVSRNSMQQKGVSQSEKGYQIAQRWIRKPDQARCLN